VLAGKDKGKEGEISSGHARESGKAIVDGVNIAVRHTRRARTARAAACRRRCRSDLSNLALRQQRQGPTRVGFRMEDGKKVRFAKTTGDVI
jgi:large subunit ribosomal protein L24